MPKFSSLTPVRVDLIMFNMMTEIVTAMDTDKIKVFGARVKVDGTGKLAELERAERVSHLYVFDSRWPIHLA